MSNHTGAVAACQTQSHIPRSEITPSPPPPETIDRRLVLRYGAWLLTGGYTAIPTYAWVYYARLGVSEAEMVCICQLCTYWWTERDPYPGEAALAGRMGKSMRTIQGYLRSLEGKGLLHIQTRLSNRGQQHTNAYDLRPFFAAVEGLARLDGLLPVDDGDDATPALSPNGRAHRSRTAGDTASCTGGPGTPPTDTQGDAERRSLCAGTERHGPDNRLKDDGTPTTEEGEGSRAGGVKNLSPQVNPIEIDSFDLDSIPPTPTYPAKPRFHKTTRAGTGDEGPQLSGAVSQDADGQALAAEITALSDELGDDAPRSSLGRARNLHRAAGVSLDRFLHLLDEAAARTRDRQASIVKRRRDGQAPNGMPYLFAVLTDLLHPAPAPSRSADAGPNRRHAERPGRRRRRRADGRGEHAGSYAAWSDSPPPRPIIEAHPVWRAVLAELAQVMTSENYNAWLASTRALDQDGEVLRVAVPTPFNKTWLEQKLVGKVAGALRKIDYDALSIGRVARVEYVVEAAACVPSEAAAQAS
jgi:hypothetical protein